MRNIEGVDQFLHLRRVVFPEVDVTLVLPSLFDLKKRQRESEFRESCRKPSTMVFKWNDKVVRFEPSIKGC